MKIKITLPHLLLTGLRPRLLGATVLLIALWAGFFLATWVPGTS